MNSMLVNKIRFAKPNKKLKKQKKRNKVETEQKHLFDLQDQVLPSQKTRNACNCISLSIKHWPMDDDDDNDYDDFV